MPHRQEDWLADYQAEVAETPTPAAKNVVYLVLECGWEYNDSFYESTSDGITHRAFRSRERAIEYAQYLHEQGKLRNWEIVERPLEEFAG